MSTRLWIAICLFVCNVADSVKENNPWIHIEGCYNITTSVRNFRMTSQARPSECFGLCNSVSVAIQGNVCYCDPYYSDNNTTIQNFLRDESCTDACQGSPKVFCGGRQSAMSVYRNDTSVLSLLGINASQHGCVYVQMNDTPAMTAYVDQFCNQTHGVLCYEHCSYSCFKSAANLTWAEALRYCSNCSGDIMSILAPSAKAFSCTVHSPTSHCPLNSDQCSPPSTGTFSFWIGLYKDEAKELSPETLSTSFVSLQPGDTSLAVTTPDDSITNVPSTQSSGSKTNVGTVIAVTTPDDSITNVPSTQSSGSKTNVGTVIAVTTPDDSITNMPSTQSSGSKTNVGTVIDDVSLALTTPVDSITNVPSTQSSGSKTNVGAVIGGCVGGIAVVGGVVVIFLFKKYRSRTPTKVIPVAPCKDGIGTNIFSGRHNVPISHIPPAWDLETSIQCAS